jgi:hypothetical protein
MFRALIAVFLFGSIFVAAGCHQAQTTPDKPAKPAGTPPPSASNLPPPLPPGKTAGPENMR